MMISILLAATLSIATCGDKPACTGARSPKISVFASFIQGVARQRNVSLDEAADMLYDLGVRGFDCSVFETQLPQLVATKIKPINLYYFPAWKDADSALAENARALDSAAKYGVPRIMTLPPTFTKDGDEEAEYRRNTANFKAFVAQAKARGITITTEDFGNAKNACSQLKYLKRMLDDIPDLRFALDSGNLYYAGRGEDILELMAYAKGRIAHVHLKDQLVEDNHKYATLGLGAVPNKQIVQTTWADGYDAWYTLENPVGDIYDDTVRQVALLKSWCACPRTRKPKMSVFSGMIPAIAKERGVTLAQAADLLYDLGICGFDCPPDAKDLDALAATKLKPINFYYFAPRDFDAPGNAANAFCLSQAVKYGVPRVMTIPPGFTENGDREAEFVRIVAGLRAFVAEAKAKGITVTVEDYGGTPNPCSYATYLKRMLDEIPDLKYALDSGNLRHAGRGEDILDMLAYAKGRIAHVHLKDIPSEDNHARVTLGLGAVPNKQIVQTTWADGYDGWYTFEDILGRDRDDRYADLVRQTAVLKTWTADATKQ